MREWAQIMKMFHAEFAEITEEDISGMNRELTKNYFFEIKRT